MENQNGYLKPVTLKNILKFAVPTIAMTVFMSFYTMVDGLFVSNLIGTDALSAINLTAPVIQLVTAVSTMLATGGSAVIRKKMGEKKAEEAREDFTALILINAAVGLLMWGLGYLAMGRVFAGMGLSARVEGYCVEYLSRYLVFTVPILLMNNFTLYLIASEKAALSLICSVTGGVLNMVLDYVFLAVFHLGIGGAAIATGLGYSVTAVAGLFVFGRKESLLHFKKPVFRLRVLVNAASNGCSEMATALVTGIVTMMFNWTMLTCVGEDGVAAVTIIMYVLMFASSLYTGYSYGVAPMLSFYHGEQNREKLKKLVALSRKVIGVVSVITVAVSLGLTEPLVSVFARPE
ncbi:MAG: polysaccharide biosynthesis C-terminal domain-containing protein, partial [Lachnospiraceae bacterium]|nr:polysaccharide biosynthesis C-terminal domain-containing protein [Lachnospiraceae bacterium]